MVTKDKLQIPYDHPLSQWLLGAIRSYGMRLVCTWCAPGMHLVAKSDWSMLPTTANQNT